MDGDDTHRPWDFFAEPDNIFASELAGPQNSVENPIGPEDEIAVNGDIERVLGRDFGQNDSVFAIQIGPFDLIQPGIGPIQFLGRQIKSQRVGHTDIGGDDGLDVETRVVGSLDSRIARIPISPVHPSVGEKITIPFTVTQQ